MTIKNSLNEFTDTWVGHLCIILIGYGSILVPGYFIIRYFKNSHYLDRAGSGYVSQLIVSCVYGHPFDKIGDETNGTKPLTKREKSFFNDFLLMAFCFLGLQVSYLTWGVLQEKIMTKEYLGIGGSRAQFNDSQFLVFINRILAFLLSGIYLGFTRQPRHIPPLYKYSFCSFSNIMSSWCQYEALKYVSFPTQVLAKASKIIPTMVMGKFISARKYEYFEYFTALFISVGMTLFLLTSTEHHTNTPTSTTLSGIIILIGYMTFDSFTSNWQGELFSQYRMSSVQMMCGVNFFSILFTSVSLLQQGGISQSVEFMFFSPPFFWDCIILSVCSASGQLFIFYTISCFGPVVFIIIMTIRQGLAILLSCILYRHPVTPVGILGILILFGAIFLRIYCTYRLKQMKSRRGASLDNTKV